MNQLTKATKLANGSTKGKLTIVCEISQDAYDLISQDINRISCLQSGIQKHLNEKMYDNGSSIKIERIEINLLSMTHVWRNFDEDINQVS